MTVHLRSDEGDAEEFCSGNWKAGDTMDGSILNCECLPCLAAALADYSERVRLVRERQRQLGNLARPKDWNACPYELHADDCNCGGAGGDR